MEDGNLFSVENREWRSVEEMQKVISTRAYSFVTVRENEDSGMSLVGKRVEGRL